MIDENDWHDDWPLVGDLALMVEDTVWWFREATPREITQEIGFTVLVLVTCWLWAVVWL